MDTKENIMKRQTLSIQRLVPDLTPAATDYIPTDAELVIHLSKHAEEDLPGQRKTLWESTLEALGSKSQCTSLTLRGHITDEEIRQLAAILDGNNILEKLDLNDNKISDDGAAYLAEMLKDNHSIKELYLSGNHIDDKGIRHLAKALNDNDTIELLDLRRNKFGRDGSIYLAGMLKVNNTLLTLSLQHNNIGDCAKPIAEALWDNTTLISLHIDATTTKSCTALASALGFNKTLKSLLLVGAEEKDLILVEKAVRGNFSIIDFQPLTPVISSYIERNLLSQKTGAETEHFQTLSASQPTTPIDIPDPECRDRSKSLCAGISKSRGIFSSPNPRITHLLRQHLSLGQLHQTDEPHHTL